MPVFLKRKIYTFFIALLLSFISNTLFAIKLNIQLVNIDNNSSKEIEELNKQLEINNLNKKDYQQWQAEYYVKSIAKEIVAYYETKGFYNTEVKKNEYLSQNLWDIKFTIYKGPPTVIKSLNINISGPGRKNVDIRKVINKSNIKTGETLNYKDYDDLKNDLFTTAENQGYFDAKITENKIYINRNENSARVIISFTTNKKYRYGDISFEQQEYSRMNEGFLYKFISFKRNQKYSYQKISNVQLALSKYFSKVIIIPKPDHKSKTVNIKIILQPFKKYRYKFGVGYSTDDGNHFIGSRRVLYLNSCGHSYEISGRLAQYNDFINLIYYSPGIRPDIDQISLGYNYLDEKKQNDKYLEKKRNEVFLNYQRQYDQYNSKVIGGIRYNLENYTTAVEEKDIHSRLLTPEFSWYKLYKHKEKFGLNINFNAIGSINDLFSTISLFKSVGYAKALYNFTKNFRTTIRGQVGQIWNSNSEVSTIPPTMRFYAGGTDSVRGYRYKSIAPRYTNPEGKEFIVGGTKLLVGSLEFATRVHGDWFAAVFGDAGNADDTWKLVRSNINKSVGVGAHYQSPIGNIKLDIARALSKKGKPWRLSLNLSPDF